MLSSSRFLLAGAALAATLFATAAPAADTMNVRFSWKLKGEYGPLYMAKEQGFFDQANLKVQMGEGAGAPAALAAMLQGQEDAVIMPAAFALTAISKGMPIKIVALYHPAAPIGLLTFSQNPVRVPKDMEGKKIGVSAGDTVTSYLPVFCKKNNVDCDKIQRISVNSQVRNSQFMTKQIDVIGTYLNVDLPLLEPLVKEPFVVLDLAKYGMVLPGLSIVVSDAGLASKPEAIARFVKAVGQGVDAARKDPAAAAAALRKEWGGAPDISVIQRQVVETLKAIPVVANRKTGWVDPALVSEALAMLKSVDELDGDRPVEAYFTNALVER